MTNSNDWIEFIKNSIEDKKEVMMFLSKDIAFCQWMKERTENYERIFMLEMMMQNDSDYIFVLAQNIKQDRRAIKNHGK